MPTSPTSIETARHSGFRDATRVLTSVLAPLEKRTLIWLARRMPGWVNSDHLTGLAFVAMLLAGLSYWLARLSPIGLPLVVAFLAVNWFGDSLDGTLARVRHHERPRYGFYVDHVVDAFGAVFLLGGLALSGYMSPFVALGLLVSYLLLCIGAYLATHCLGTFTLSFLKVGPTELRIILAIGTLTLLVRPTAMVFGHAYRLFDVGGVVGTIGMVLTLVAIVARNARALFKAEPLPRTATPAS